MPDRPIEKPIEIVAVLGARLRENAGEPFYEFPLHIDSDKEGMPLGKDGRPKEVVGGDSRLLAASVYFFGFDRESSERDIRFLTLGGYEEIFRPDGSMAQISRSIAMRDKMIGKHGMPEYAVEAYHSDPSTLGNADAFFEWLHAHPDTAGRLSEAKILTNEFHMTRSWIMFAHAQYADAHGGKDLCGLLGDDFRGSVSRILDETLPDNSEGDGRALSEIRRLYETFLSDMPFRIVPLVAEDILAASGSLELTSYANDIRNDSLVRQARKNERHGIKMLLEGEYLTKKRLI